MVSGEMGGLPVKVTVVEELGADAYIYGQFDADGIPGAGEVTIRVDGRRSHRKGETVCVTTNPEHVHVFDSATGQRVSA